MLDSNAGPLLYKVIEGTVFGESSLVRQLEGADKVKRRESVLAKSPCDMLRLPEADCVDMCEHYPELLRCDAACADARARAHVCVHARAYMYMCRGGGAATAAWRRPRLGKACIPLLAVWERG